MARVCPRRGAGARSMPRRAGRAKISPWHGPLSTSPATPRPTRSLSRDPLALLIGMVLDQQVTIEKAFSLPGRAGSAARRPPRRRRHRRHGARGAGRASSRNGRPCTVSPAPWPAGCRRSAVPSPRSTGTRPTTSGRASTAATELLGRLKALPGFGEQKAKIFAALLGKQLGVRPEGWREATAPYGGEGTHLSVADITGPESLEQGPGDQEGHEGEGARRGVTRRAPTSRAATSTSARRTGPTWPTSWRTASTAGVDVVQLRDKDLEARPLLARARVVGGGVPRPRCALRAQRPARSRARSWRRRRPCGSGRRARRAGPAHPGPRRHRRAFHPLPRPTWRPRRTRT